MKKILSSVLMCIIAMALIFTIPAAGYKAYSATNTATTNALIKYAKSFLGKPYVWGSASASRGFDCSGFTMTVMKKFGVSLSHSSRIQYSGGKSIERSNLKAGDVLFFGESQTRIRHVAIYIGNDQFIHASSTKHKVVIDNFSRYIKYTHYFGAKRFPFRVIT